MAGSIGSFYFGPIIINSTIELEKLDLSLTIQETSEIAFDTTIKVPNLLILVDLFNPVVKSFSYVSLDFIANPVSGKSPLTVEFTAIPKVSSFISYPNLTYNWYFDFDNYPTTYETTTDETITHVYSGKVGDKYSVKLVGTFSF